MIRQHRWFLTSIPLVVGSTLIGAAQIGPMAFPLWLLWTLTCGLFGFGVGTAAQALDTLAGDGR